MDVDMGALAEALMEYARPLLEQTDGSPEEMQKALTLSTLCYNLALVPDDKRDAMIEDMRSDLPMDDEEFDDFRRSIILPMIARHAEMFSPIHRRVSAATSQSARAPWVLPRSAERAEKPPKIDRYAPCPCNSGKKYKFCCGAKSR
jgi:hypothetical protein